MKDVKLKNSLRTLIEALKAYEADRDNEMYSLAVSKSFEVSFEYVWKHV